jgi:deferrochelatase/peroxidase EfeB
MAGGVSRRRVLTVGGAGVAGAVAAGTVGVLTRDAAAEQTPGSDMSDAVPFYGEHQAGITTPAQDRLHFVTFDVTTASRADLVDLLREWSRAAARMTAGHDAGPVGAVAGSPDAPPDDTGEAMDLPASGLTLTVGHPGSHRPLPTYHIFPAMPSTRPFPVATSAFRRAHTTRRLRYTPCGIWPGSASAR